MRTKTKLKVLGGIIVLVIIFGVFKIATFKLFDSDISLLERINVPNKKYSIEIYYIPSDATIQSNIQIRKLQSGVVEVLERYERYNHLDEYKIIEDDTLSITISDTSRIGTAQEIKIKLP